MLRELLRRGPSTTTIALLYAAVVVVAGLVVTAVLPTTLPESNAADHRLLPEYKELKSCYERVIKERERAVEQELTSLYDEATRSKNDRQTQFWIDQKSSWELRKPKWDPRKGWQEWFPGVELPERLSGILQQYENRYFDAAAMLKDEYEKLARDLVRRGQPEMAEALRAEATRRWPVDLRPPQPNEDPPVQVVQVPPLPEPEPIVEPEAVKPDELVVEDPVAMPPAVVEATEAPGAVEVVQDPPPPKKRFIDLNSFECRKEERRKRLVEAFGGDDATEAAVAKALAWLKRQQGGDGSWSLQGPYGDGGLHENRVAATAMALLAFQGSGNTPTQGEYQNLLAFQESGKKSTRGKNRNKVFSGVRWLLANQMSDGHFADPRPQPEGNRRPQPENQGLYTHALATIALCELYGMTNDNVLAEPARRALNYALAAQGPDGGWRYKPRENGDMSVTAWYMRALKSGQMAGLEVPAPRLVGIDAFLASVAIDRGKRYGYRQERPNTLAAPETMATSAAGLLCRQYRGWPRDDPRLEDGVQRFVNQRDHLDWQLASDAYACHTFTQVAYHMGGPTWRLWNDRMKNVLTIAQVKEGHEDGSWDPSIDRWGKEGGRLFVTCFYTYMLQVYYRYPPIYESRLDECGL